MTPLAAGATIINTFFPDSQAELEYLFESGQIDAIEYELWDEYFITTSQAAGDSASISADYPDSLDNLELMDNPAELAKEESSPGAGLSTDFSYRYYQKFSESNPQRELTLLRGSYNKTVSWFLETERKSKFDDHYFRRRYIRFSDDKYEAVLGNFEPEWGMGITLGHHYGFLEKDINPLYNSFLFPSMGRYNGLKIRYDSYLSPVVMLSYDRSQKSRGRLAALGLDYRKENISIGMLANYHKIDNLTSGAEYSGMILGNYLSARYGDYSLSMELSESEGKYFAGCFELKKKYADGVFMLSGWNYPQGYLNPYGAGPSNSDYESIAIEDTEIEYRSRQNGEWGLLAKTSFRLFPAHQVNIAANYWSDGGLEEKYRAKLSDKWKLNKTMDVIFTYLWGDDNLDADYGDRQQIRLDFIYGKSMDMRLRLSTELKRIYYISGRHDYLRAEIKGIYPISEGIKTVVKISRIDYDITDNMPGYWLLYLGEDIALAKQIFMRTVLDTREGKMYNLIDAARINLQLSFTL